MKKLILTACALTCAVSVFAQGTVVFNNRVAGTLVTHVYYNATVNTAVFGNGATDLPAGTQDWTGYTLLAGSGYMAQLLAASGANQAESSLQAASSPATTFRMGAAAGFIAGVGATLAGVPGDTATATLEMVVWDNSSGQYPTWATAKPAWLAGTIAAGASPLFNLNGIGGTVNQAPVLAGLQSFNIYYVPEPSTMALAGLGAAALLIFRRRK